MVKKIGFEEHFATKEQLDVSSLVIENQCKVKEVAREEPILGRELPFLFRHGCGQHPVCGGLPDGRRQSCGEVH